MRPAGPGTFSSVSDAQGSLNYRLYAPAGHAGRRLPLVVMLHGCTQDPDDFAAGTAMNERAREQGFFVLYPAQAPCAHPQRCWNWFEPLHQRRGSGEPARLASMTQAVIARFAIDPRRVYIAGMSAGGAMAAIVAATYPELFAAVGIHSGLPTGGASDFAGALALMRNGVTRPARCDAARRPMPTIVFHGDRDLMVHPRNGEQLIAAALAHAASAPRVEQGVSAAGRSYTRSLHGDGRGRAMAEHWVVHGGGHAWSGGRAEATCTDAKGPDATREMLRFFFAQRRTVSRGGASAPPRAPATHAPGA